MSGSGNIVSFPDRSPVEEEAARWVVRLDEGVSAAERAEFEAWRQASPQNSAAFARLKEHWGGLDELASLAATPSAQPLWSRPVVWAAGGLAAAVLAFAVIAGAGWLPRPSGSPVEIAQQPGLGVYRTELGRQETITLADGSIVTLNTASRIEARINGQERTVRLLEGEAFFEVAHDATRPFRVYAGDGVTVAIGTAFSVRLNKDAIEVIVSEGKVSFARVADKVEPVAYVAAGETATFSDNVVIERADNAEVDRKLSWTEGRLIFAGAPLSSVVADISRYTDIHFDYASQEVADTSIGGVFPIGAVDDMLDSIEANFPVRIVRIDEKHVLFTAR